MYIYIYKDIILYIYICIYLLVYLQYLSYVYIYFLRSYTYVVEVRVHPDLFLTFKNTTYSHDFTWRPASLCVGSMLLVEGLSEVESIYEIWTAGLLHWLSLKKSYHHQNQQMKHMLLSQETLKFQYHFHHWKARHKSTENDWTRVTVPNVAQGINLWSFIEPKLCFQTVSDIRIVALIHQSCSDKNPMNGPEIK